MLASLRYRRCCNANTDQDDHNLRFMTHRYHKASTCKRFYRGHHKSSLMNSNSRSYKKSAM